MKRIRAGLDAAERTGTDHERGLSPEQVEASRQKHGENRLPTIKGESLFAMFLEALSDKTLLILMGAAVLAIGVEVLRSRVQDGYTAHYLDGIAILSAVLIASVVATVNQARAQKEFRSLSSTREDIPVKVLRAGEVREVSIYELVVGDVIYLNTGDRVPADGSLLSAVDLSIDESALTGESIASNKDEADAELLAGTSVVGGTAAMIV